VAFQRTEELTVMQNFSVEFVVDAIIGSGPDRVMVQGNFATTPRKAREVYKVIPEIIFIRNDGWSLGAPAHLVNEAFMTWHESWSHFLLRGKSKAQPISEFNIY